MFSTILVVAFCIFTGHSSRNALEEENARLLRQKTALLQGLASLASETAVAVEDQESQVGFRVSCVSDGKCPDRYYVCIHGRCAMPTDATDTETAVAVEEKEVGLTKYKCEARNVCIIDCQEKDETKTWYACMKECPKSLCQDAAESDSIDPEEDDSETAVGVTCRKDGFLGSVTSDSWCDKSSGAWWYKCSDCRYGYYWWWWHTYCCTRGKSGCTCAYN